MHFEEFHHLSKDRGLGHDPVPEEYADWPLEWKTIYYKTYPDLPLIHLPSENPPQRDLFASIQERRSTIHFRNDSRPITLLEASHLFKFSCGVQEVKRVSENRTEVVVEYHRAQPSGGGRYPIEAYLLNFKSGELPSGVYHYDVKKHGLNVLNERPFSADDISTLFTYGYVQQASFAVVLTATFWRTRIKYGERGYRYILLEAGHIGQNMMLITQLFKRGCVPLGGTIDEAIEASLDIDGVTESLVYGVVFGDEHAHVHSVS